MLGAMYGAFVLSPAVTGTRARALFLSPDLHSEAAHHDHMDFFSSCRCASPAGHKHTLAPHAHPQTIHHKQVRERAQASESGWWTMSHFNDYNQRVGYLKWLCDC